jgi:hypothetical protein
MSLSDIDYQNQLRKYLDVKLSDLVQEAEFIFTHEVDITRKYNYSVRVLEIVNELETEMNLSPDNPDKPYYRSLLHMLRMRHTSYTV